LFDTDQSTLKAGADSALQPFAAQLRAEFPNARLTFVGHTDSRGSDEHNFELSMARAKAVRDWFVEHGFNEALLSVEGRGETELLSPDTVNGVFDEEIGQLNRRVVIEPEVCP
jgi:outer membrane protein OmpA-like peptidoglycan-associated protein